MVYVRAWDETKPVGATTQSSDIDLAFQQLKADLRERLNDLVADWTTDPVTFSYKCWVYPSVNLSVANNSETAVGFDSEIVDVGNLHDTVTNNSRITVPAGAVKGLWVVHGHVDWAQNGTGNREARLYKNGATFLGRCSTVPSATDFVTDYVWGAVLAPVAGDYFEMKVTQTSGGNLNLLGGLGSAYLEARYVP